MPVSKFVQCCFLHDKLDKSVNAMMPEPTPEIRLFGYYALSVAVFIVAFLAIGWKMLKNSKGVKVKKSGFVFVAVLAVASFFAQKAMAFDGVYFQHPTSLTTIPTSIDAAISMKGQGLGATQTVNLYAPLFHMADPKNSIIPASWQSVIPPESWTLSVGWAGNSGAYKGLIGATVNLWPTGQNALSKAFGAVGASTLSSDLAYNPSSNLQMLFGPMLEFTPFASGTVLPFNRFDWQGVWVFGPTYFIGANTKTAKIEHAPNSDAIESSASIQKKIDEVIF